MREEDNGLDLICGPFDTTRNAEKCSRALRGATHARTTYIRQVLAISQRRQQQEAVFQDTTSVRAQNTITVRSQSSLRMGRSSVQE